MDRNALFLKIKDSFSKLFSFKIKGDVVEITTPYATLNNKFASVFLKIEQERIVITDGGWTDSNSYDYPVYDDSEEIVKKALEAYKTSLGIKETDSEGITYYYKVCENAESAASAVLDLANFIVGTVNMFTIRFTDKKEEKERDSFRSDADIFLKNHYGSKKIQLKQSLEDFQNIKFNAVISTKGKLHLITYISGSNPYYFENDIRKTIVNFEISFKSKYKDIIGERLSVINDQSAGYEPEKAKVILDLLAEKTSRKPIHWSEKDRILDYLPA